MSKQMPLFLQELMSTNPVPAKAWLILQAVQGNKDLKAAAVAAATAAAAAHCTVLPSRTGALGQPLLPIYL